jgi:DNA-binding NarL/FixJ family response regulator
VKRSSKSQGRPPTKSAPQPSAAIKIAPAAKRRILVVDDHPMTRSGLVYLLDKQPDLEVCGEAGNPAEALTQISRLKPDLLMTDITMPGRSGIELLKDIRALHPELAIVVVSMHDEAVYAERALRAGARGYVMKEVGGETLLHALRQVLSGSVYVSAAMAAKLLNSFTGDKPRKSSSPIETLTDREFEVFQLIGQGRSTRDIAKELHLSSKTVDVHRGHIKEKLHLEDVTSLIRYAVRWVESEKPSGATDGV